MRLRMQSAWNWLRKRVDVTYTVAALLLLVGIIIYFTANNIGWLIAVSGALAGAGFTTLISTVVGKQAIREQYAKEANLRRKNEVYGPLHAELKRLHTTFSMAQSGLRPFPDLIQVGPSAAVGNSGVFFPAANLPPDLQLWPEFKKDFRADDFTVPAHEVFDEAHALAESYNEAIASVVEPTVEILAKIVEDAITEVRQSQDYQIWRHERGNVPTTAMPVGYILKVDDDWFRRFEMGSLPESTLGHAWAAQWLRSWPLYFQPSTVGWLLVSRPDQAARFVYAGYQPSSNDIPPPPLEWLEGIFKAALPSLDAQPTFIKARAAEDALFAKLSDAVRMLEKGLTDIQNRYEGGAPPV